MHLPKIHFPSEFLLCGQKYVQIPTSRHDWEQVCEGFETRTGLPKCIGAIDGKHIYITQPGNSGSAFYNFKGSFSVVLFIMCDAFHRMMFYSVGHRGSSSDSTIFECSGLKRFIDPDQNNLLPLSTPWPGREMLVPNFVLADDAFALRPYILKPYKGTALTDEQLKANTIISSSRRIVESTFGILVHRFRVLFRRMGIHTASVNRVVGACVTLHNWLITHNAHDYSDDVMSLQLSEILRERSLQQRRVLIANPNENNFNEIIRVAANENRRAHQCRDEFCLYINENRNI